MIGIYWYLRWQMWLLWVPSLYYFSLLGYQMIFFIGETGCPVPEICFAWGKLIILFLYIWLRNTDSSGLDVLFWFRNTGSTLVRLSQIKNGMQDKINRDIWIRTCRLENNWQGFSLVDTNFEASYQFWAIKKCRWLKTVIQ